MATWSGRPWNSLRTLVTTQGVFASVYHPGNEGEWVEVLGPSGASQRVDTPKLLDWQLVAFDGKLVVYYNRDAGDGKRDLVAVYTPIVCGGMVGELVAGATGPMGPSGGQGPRGETGPQGPPGQAGGDAEVTQDVIDAIARRVWTLPPGEFANISGLDLGTMAQESTVYPFTQRQDLYQRAAHRAGEALANMVKDGNLPPVPE